MSEKRVFISYSHADKTTAERLAHDLNAKGIHVWLDRWELQPGDSLVARIFEEGLSTASHFLVLLSPNSVKSRWVREELDVATVRRIEDLVRIIPVVIGDAEIPASLRALVWVDLRVDFDDGVERIANVIQGISSKPSRPPSQPIVEVEPIGGLSRAATAIGNLLLNCEESRSDKKSAYLGSELQERLQIAPEAINDAVEELFEAGLVQVMRALGTAPYRFVQIEPTYVLFREFRSRLNYDPDEDVRVVAAAIAARKHVRGRELEELTGLTPDRLNRAVEYLDDFKIANVSRAFGTAPFNFSGIYPTHRTRRFVEEAS